MIIYGKEQQYKKTQYVGIGRKRGGAAQYAKVNTQSSIEDASPHRLIQMLFEGAISAIGYAKTHLDRNEIPEKCASITRALHIIGGLRVSLDKENGGEIADNLDNLYDYMERRLVEANAKNSPVMLDEILGLLKEIKGGWDSIPEEFHHHNPVSI